MDVAFQDYVDRLLRPQDAAALGSGESDPPGSDLVPDPVLTRFLSSAETLYFFGDNNLTEWQNLLDRYRAPPYFLPGCSAAYSFGIAGQWEGTGPDLLRATNGPRTALWTHQSITNGPNHPGSIRTIVSSPEPPGFCPICWIRTTGPLLTAEPD